MSREPAEQPKVQTYAAIYIEAGVIRRVWFEATTEERAATLAAGWNVGLEGPVARPTDAPPPLAYPEKTARQLMGDVSRSFLYKELALGRLERVTGTRRLLITRESLERWTRN